MKVNNQKFYLFGIFFSISLLLILFTNMGLADLSLADLRSESLNVSRKLINSSTSEKVKAVLRQQKQPLMLTI